MRDDTYDPTKGPDAPENRDEPDMGPPPCNDAPGVGGVEVEPIPPLAYGYGAEAINKAWRDGQAMVDNALRDERERITRRFRRARNLGFATFVFNVALFGGQMYFAHKAHVISQKTKAMVDHANAVSRQLNSRADDLCGERLHASR